jgi:hypothetical protein
VEIGAKNKRPTRLVSTVCFYPAMKSVRFPKPHGSAWIFSPCAENQFLLAGGGKIRLRRKENMGGGDG